MCIRDSFGIYAQLTQLAGFDPTPAAVCLKNAPRVFAWVDLVDDLTGQTAEEDSWLRLEEDAAALQDLLTEIGRTYVPALLANAQAIQAGSEQMETTIDGQAWQQPTFPYQAKCLQWINAEYRKLDAASKAQVDELLAGTGCEALLL